MKCSHGKRFNGSDIPQHTASDCAMCHLEQEMFSKNIEKAGVFMVWIESGLGPLFPVFQKKGAEIVNLLQPHFPDETVFTLLIRLLCEEAVESRKTAEETVTEFIMRKDPLYLFKNLPLL